MEYTNRKSHLLGLMRTEHSQLEALLNSLSEEQMLRPDVAGTWSVKDVLTLTGRCSRWWSISTKRNSPTRNSVPTSPIIPAITMPSIAG